MKQPLILACAVALSCTCLAQVAGRPPITGIAFSRFYTTDLPAAKNFCGGTLGFEGL